MTTSDEKKQEQHEEPQPVIVYKNKGNALGVFSFLLALAACGASGYVLYQFQQQPQHQITQTQQVPSEIENVKKDFQTTSSQMDTFLKKINATQEAVSLLEQRMNQLALQKTSRAEDWTLLKGRYYLELAQANARFGVNQDSTSALLSEADEILASLHDTSLIDVRHEIALEKEEVAKQERVDLIGILTKLEVAQQQVQNLKPQSMLAETKESTTQNTISKNGSFRDHINETLSTLQNLVVIRRYDGDIKPIMNPMYATILREEIAVILQEAQFAALQGNDSLYQFTLGQAVTKIKRSFDLNHDDTKTLLTQLGNLQQLKFECKKVQVEKSLTLLNQLIEAKNKMPKEHKEILPAKERS